MVFHQLSENTVDVESAMCIRSKKINSQMKCDGSNKTIYSIQNKTRDNLRRLSQAKNLQKKNTKLRL